MHMQLQPIGQVVFRADVFFDIFSTFLISKAVVYGKTTKNSLFDVFGTSDLLKIDFLWPQGPQGAERDPRGGEGGPERHFDTPTGD